MEIRENFYDFDLAAFQVFRCLSSSREANILTGEKRVALAILGGLYANGKTTREGVMNLCGRNSVFTQQPALDRLENAIHDLEAGKILGRASICIK